MHHTHLDAIQVVQKLHFRLDPNIYDRVDVSIHPAFTALRSVQTLIQSDRVPILLGAQNCHPEPQGAFTGEVSPAMLAKLDVGLVIVGHSERRAGHGETDAIVATKAKAAVRGGLEPIVCVGETLEQREAGDALTVVTGQVRGSLPRELERTAFAVAYEPVWAIGTGLTPTTPQIEEMHRAIRATIVELFGDEGAKVPILYGGSVKPSNAAEILHAAEVGGALVGGASLKAADFLGIVGAI